MRAFSCMTEVLDSQGIPKNPTIATTVISASRNFNCRMPFGVIHQGGAFFFFAMETYAENQLLKKKRNRLKYFWTEPRTEQHCNALNPQDCC